MFSIIQLFLCDLCASVFQKRRRVPCRSREKVRGGLPRGAICLNATSNSHDACYLLDGSGCFR